MAGAIHLLSWAPRVALFGYFLKTLLIIERRASSSGPGSVNSTPQPGAHYPPPDCQIVETGSMRMPGLIVEWSETVFM